MKTFFVEFHAIAVNITSPCIYFTRPSISRSHYRLVYYEKFTRMKFWVRARTRAERCTDVPGAYSHFDH